MGDWEFVVEAEIKDFEDSKRSFRSSTGSSDFMNAPITRYKTKDRRLMVRSDARVANVENKIDTLAPQVENMTLVLNMSQSGYSVQYSNSHRTWSYCQNTGLGANRCPDNPHWDTKSYKFQKKGNSDKPCWSCLPKKEYTAVSITSVSIKSSPHGRTSVPMKKMTLVYTWS